MSQMKYPIGVQSFPKIREGGFLYVDKTEYIYKLIKSCQYVFLSRPRRFGKSLLLSTIEEIYKGNRHLFEGLKISGFDYDWKSCPVLHLDFTGRDYSNPDALDAHLNEVLTEWEKIYGDDFANSAPEERFRKVIELAKNKTGKSVVVLIDEYDKPLLETVDNYELQKSYRNKLRSVYGNLKKMDSYIEFAMLTGVTKFASLSIFSDLNNINDISLDRDYSGICGVTTDELQNYFNDGIEEFAKYNGLTHTEVLDLLRVNYDGYHFSPKGSEDIYNPFSLLNALQKKEIGEYWYRTGTPTFLVEMIKARQLPLIKLNDIEISQSEVENVSFDIGSTLIPVLYQTGYLTIKDYLPLPRLLRLGFPNREVENGFMLQLMKLYIPNATMDPTFCIYQFYKDVEECRPEEFMQRLQSFFSDFSYECIDLKRVEQYFQDVTYIVFKLLGFMTAIEYKTSSGRIDMVVKTSLFIYVFEFKIDKSAKEAIAQIDDRDYLLPFQKDGRRIIKIGANFSSRTRSLESWLIEEC